MYSIKDISEYIVALIAAFGHHFSISDTEAYQYLRIHSHSTIWYRVWLSIADGKEVIYDDTLPWL